ncbi:hypothetical protein OROMI_014938 [Orobanche minor]
MPIRTRSGRTWPDVKSSLDRSRPKETGQSRTFWCAVCETSDSNRPCLSRVVRRVGQVSALCRNTAGQNGPSSAGCWAVLCPAINMTEQSHLHAFSHSFFFPSVTKLLRYWRHVVGKLFHEVPEFISSTDRSITPSDRPNQGTGPGVCDVLREIGDKIDARLRDLTKRIGYDFDVSIKRNQAFELLGAIEGLSLEDRFDVCDLLAKEIEKLDVFMGLPQDAREDYVMRILSSLRN